MPPPIRHAAGKRGPAATTCPPDLAPLLGTMTDKAVAKQAGVSQATAFRWRNEAGIPPFDRRGAKDRHEARPTASMREVVKAALEEAKPGPGGMVIPHTTYARLCTLFFGDE